MLTGRNNGRARVCPFGGGVWGAAAAALLLGACAPSHFRADYQPLPVQVTIKALAQKPTKIEIRDRVRFRVNSAELLQDSHSVLDEVAQAIMRGDQIQVVEIQGHTDSRGDRQHNVELSQDRAEEVREYLIGKGVPSDRLRARGYGPDKPVADNGTPEGRQKNRRVEFIIASAGSANSNTKTN